MRILAYNFFGYFGDWYNIRRSGRQPIMMAAGEFDVSPAFSFRCDFKLLPDCMI